MILTIKLNETSSYSLNKNYLKYCNLGNKKPFFTTLN